MKKLQQDLKSAESNVLAKAGEVAIVRNNIQKSNKEHERLISSIQAIQNEEREKLEQELKAAREETELVKTKNLFLKNDYEEVIRKNKSLERTVSMSGDEAGKKRAMRQSPVTTPKKKKVMHYRDGFDDDEIMVSPSKAQIKSKVTTPSKKRKRTASGSPAAFSLPLSQLPRAPISNASSHVQLVDLSILEKLLQDNTQSDVCYSSPLSCSGG